LRSLTGAVVMVQFSKFEALGNDFVLIDARQNAFDPLPHQVERLGDRHRGIGFDQLLILRSSDQATVSIDIHNHDGSLAEQCGNGMRAVALYLHLQEEIAETAVFATRAGTVQINFQTAERISATLPPPDFKPPPASPLADGDRWTEHRDGIEFELNYVSLGNPHLVIGLNAPASSDLLMQLGQDFSQHPALPQGANISLAHVASPDRIDLAVFERGAGPTLACGSGACATAVSMIRQQRADRTVRVDQSGGSLMINWQQDGDGITMTGAARRVFTGEFDPNIF